MLIKLVYPLPRRSPDHALDQLTERGWYREAADFPTEDPSEEESGEEDPVARQLRYTVGIYNGRRSEFFVDYADATPWVGTAEDVLELKPTNEIEEGLYSTDWPSTPEEMSERLRRVIPPLQAEPHRFWDPGVDEWCNTAQISYISDEKTRKEAYLY